MALKQVDELPDSTVGSRARWSAPIIAELQANPGVPFELMRGRKKLMSTRAGYLRDHGIDARVVRDGDEKAIVYGVYPAPEPDKPVKKSRS